MAGFAWKGAVNRLTPNIMFVRCPACHTLFRIEPRQLKAARGQVRCGSCGAVFDGLESLVNREEMSREELSAISRTAETDTRQWQLPFDEAPESADQPTEEKKQANVTSPSRVEKITPVSSTANAESAVDRTQNVQPPSAAPENKPEASTTEPPQPVKIRLKPPRYDLTSSEPEPVPKRTGARIAWALGSLLMMALLAGQIIFHNRESLALDPHWRPWLQRVCDHAGCVLPPQRDPKAIEMVDRNVQSHPKYQNALLITATLVNQAPFPQPYPLVELSMTDLDQKRIASRLFKPSEYVEGGNGKGLIPPGGSVRLKLEIADPGQEAVGFEFEFF